MVGVRHQDERPISSFFNSMANASQQSTALSAKRSVHDLDDGTEDDIENLPEIAPKRAKVTVTLRNFHLENPATISGLLTSLKVSAGERRRLVVSWLEEHPVLARYVLTRAGTNGKTSVARVGWCQVVSNVDNKSGGGYVQPSYWGVNHIALLHRISLWADGKDLQPGQEASHLCGNTHCKTTGHIAAEDATANNARKNCLVWMVCPCEVGQKLLLCTHVPPCIKYCAGFESQEQFLRLGVCHSRSAAGQPVAWTAQN